MKKSAKIDTTKQFGTSNKPNKRRSPLSAGRNKKFLPIRLQYVCIFIIILLNFTSCIRTNFGKYIASYGMKTRDYQNYIPISDNTVYRLDGKYYMRLTVVEKRVPTALIYAEGFGIENDLPLFGVPDDSNLANNPLCKKNIFLSLGSDAAKVGVFDYDEHIPYADFDLKRAVPCGNSTEWHKLFVDHVRQKEGKIRIFLRNSSRPEKNDLYNYLIPFEYMGYLADIPCSVVTTGVYLVACPFLGLYYCIMSPEV